MSAEVSPERRGALPFRSVQNGFFIALVVLVTLAFLGLIQDFLVPIFWAAVLATLFYPVQERWIEVTGGRSALASVLTILTIILIVILPLVLVGRAVTVQSLSLYEQVRTGQIDVQGMVSYLESLVPVVGDYLDEYGIDAARIREGVSGAAVTVSQFVASQALNIGQDALRISIQFFLMLYVLFFFLRDGERIIEGLIRALPLGDRRERALFSQFAAVSRATLKGTFVVGIIQGGLGGLLFWMLGLPAPVFWGVIMTILSLLPAIGSGLVWAPAAVILLLTGEVVRGLVLIAAGALLIGLVDNILRPILVGRETQMPDYLILLSTLGGLTVFGISGFVIGPIIAALFLTVWQMFGDEYAEADQHGDVDAPTTPEEVAAVKEAAEE